MLQTLQIITIIQGVFLLCVLLKNRSLYKNPTYFLFIGALVSVLLFLLGDDENNPFLEETDLFLFDSTLFVTFLFLLFRYHKSGKKSFSTIDLYFFIPNLLYFSFELLEIFDVTGYKWFEYIENLVEFIFLIYLVFILVALIKDRSKQLVLYLVFPVALYFGLNLANDILDFMDFEEIVFSDSPQQQSYFLVTMAFLFYYITYHLIVRPKKLLPLLHRGKYRGSRLSNKKIELYHRGLIDAMENKELYKDPKLSIHIVAHELGIPRQYLSEILNIHIGQSFKDFVNTYRLEAFIELLAKDLNNQYTIYGLATEVGFNSKTNFNTIFKKHKGITPSQFKSSLKQMDEIGAN